MSGWNIEWHIVSQQTIFYVVNNILRQVILSIEEPGPIYNYFIISAV